jgi:hypothetical protein
MEKFLIEVAHEAEKPLVLRLHKSYLNPAHTL